MNPVWSSAVIAAGLASLLTLVGTVVRDALKNRRDRAAAVLQARSAAYSDLLVRSFSVLLRANAARTAIQFRSGLQENLAVALRLRKMLDPLELHDWLNTDMAPFNDAWSRVWVVGSQDAINAADRLVGSCTELFELLTSLDASLSRATRFLKGEIWTAAKSAEYDAKLRAFSLERVAFVRMMRKELGGEAVEFALERAARAGGTPELTAAPASPPVPYPALRYARLVVSRWSRLKRRRVAAYSHHEGVQTGGSGRDPQRKVIEGG